MTENAPRTRRDVLKAAGVAAVVTTAGCLDGEGDNGDGTGYTIYPIEPGFGTRLLTETVLREDGLWDDNDINNEDTDDIPGAVEEGRVDALCLYGANQVELAGWCQEVDVRSDGQLYLIDADDQFIDAIEAVPGATLVVQDPYPYEQDVTSHLGIDSDVVHWALQGQWAFGEDVHPDAVYEMARVALEHHDTLRESDPTTLEYTPETMTEVLMPDVPVHPGMVEFYEDHGVWDSGEWEEGEANADDEDEYTITIAGTASGSSTQAAAQALARGASEHSDLLTIDVQESEGWTGNLYDFDAGDFSTIGVDNNSWSAAINEETPFDDDPVDNLPQQGFLFTSLEMHWVAMEGSDIESTADLRV